MYQDGSDKSLGGAFLLEIKINVSNNDIAKLLSIENQNFKPNGHKIPLALCLRLIGSGNNPLASELVPFANSYDVRGVYKSCTRPMADPQSPDVLYL